VTTVVARSSSPGDTPPPPIVTPTAGAAAPGGRARGYSFVELLFVTGILATISGIAVPAFNRGLDYFRAREAVRFVSGRLQRTRAEAVARGRHVALQFSHRGGNLEFRAFVDRNGNGVSSSDIENGIDTALGAPYDLADFPGAAFGVIPGVPAPEGGPLGSDPVRFGGGRLVSFSPAGTATPGSLYLSGRDGSQYVVRVYGDTGKSHVLRFNRVESRWVPL
jgi:type II secretory pathway pseudopilin PulG